MGEGEGSAEPGAASPRGGIAWLWWALGAGAFLCAGLAVLLVTVTVDNMNQFNCRARQSEAKTNLAGIFTSEKAFFGEYEAYTTDLVALSWHPDGRPRYLYGFSAPVFEEEARLRAAIPGYDPRRSSTDHPEVIGPANAPRYSIAQMQGRTRAVLPPSTGVNGRTFLVAAVGDVGDGDGTPDVWTIDESKVLRNPSNDCRD